MVTKIKRNKGVINRIIRRHLAKNPKLIVHGARAQNAQMPRNLSRPSTVDWDVFSPNPKQSAMRLERKLDKKFRGDVFEVKPGATTRLDVQKVKSKLTGETFADFSKPDRIVPTIALRGKHFATLADQKQRAQQNIKDPSKDFRRAKDLDLLKRIKIFQRKRPLI